MPRKPIEDIDDNKETCCACHKEFYLENGGHKLYTPETPSKDLILCEECGKDCQTQVIDIKHPGLDEGLPDEVPVAVYNDVMRWARWYRFGVPLTSLAGVKDFFTELAKTSGFNPDDGLDGLEDREGNLLLSPEQTTMLNARMAEAFTICDEAKTDIYITAMEILAPESDMVKMDHAIRKVREAYAYIEPRTGYLGEDWAKWVELTEKLIKEI